MEPLAAADVDGLAVSYLWNVYSGYFISLIRLVSIIHLLFKYDF